MNSLKKIQRSSILKQNLLFFISLLLVVPMSIAGQDYDQNIRGTVVDKQSQYPLIGATVVLLGTEPLLGTTTDINGEFVFEDVAVGRHSLKISYMGYEPVTMSKLLLQSGKELVVNVQLEEKVITTKEVVIKAENKKHEVLNKMAPVSARSFTIEETNKYAGSLGDPARMAANFAGVLTANDSRNDIIIRGNSPIGVLWRLEGVEIPNPNHFGALGTTGGPVSMLNNNLLAKSDFLTGAFPAEFGNATAGAFDLKMRPGNNQKREYVGQIGFNGFELGAEGPFSKDSRASYLASYRYSTLAVFDALGFEGVQGSSVPDYQDFSFKIDVPGIQYGRFTLFGLGGLSKIKLYDTEKDSTEFSYGLNGTNTDFGSDMGILGLTHQHFLNKTTRVNTSLSATYSRSYTWIDSIHKSVEDSIYPWLRSDQRETKYSFTTKINKKFNARNNLTAGILYDHFYLNLKDSIINSETKEFETYHDTEEDFSLLRAFAQWKHKFNDDLSLYSGLHMIHLPMNGSTSIEPRLGLKWRVMDNHSINFGYGLHSQMQPKMTYFFITHDDQGNTYQTNKNMGFTKSNHLVLGYDYLVTENFRIKSEVYYQYLFNVPVSPRIGDFSMLNEGAFFAISAIDSLENSGTGTNYGFEITLEKFLSNGYYFLLTASIFESKYKGYDGVERNTAFNGNYVFNALGGYEYRFSEKATLALDLRGVWAGGKRYTPINVQESIIQEKTVYYYNQTYLKKHDDYLKFDIRLSFKMNGKKINQEWAIDLKNITNHQNVFMQSYNPSEGQIHTDYQEGFYPMFLYRINF